MPPHTCTNTLKAEAHNVKVLSQHLELQLTDLAVHKIGIFGIDRQNSFSCENKQTSTLSLPLSIYPFCLFLKHFSPSHSITHSINRCHFCMSKFSLVTWYFISVGCLRFYRRRPSNRSNLLRSVNKIYHNALSLQHHPSVCRRRTETKHKIKRKPQP